MRPQTRFFLSGRAGAEHLVRTRKGRVTLLDFMDLPLLELEVARPRTAWEAASDAARCEELLGALVPLTYDPVTSRRAAAMRDRIIAVLNLRLSFPGAEELIGVLEVMEF